MIGRIEPWTRAEYQSGLPVEVTLTRYPQNRLSWSVYVTLYVVAETGVNLEMLISRFEKKKKKPYSHHCDSSC